MLKLGIILTAATVTILVVECFFAAVPRRIGDMLLSVANWLQGQSQL
jgi:hypothetical protein